MNDTEHNCSSFGECIKIKCNYGASFDHIFYSEMQKVWFLGNREYYTKVNYCPCCGIKLEVPQSDSNDNGVHPIGKT
jgi:hypothetical protein